MKKTPLEWMLEREKGALQRLDSMREAAVSTERPTVLDMILEVFRPDLPVWAVLAIAWIALAATDFAISAPMAPPSTRGGYETDLANLNLTRDDALSYLDPNP